MLSFFFEFFSPANRLMSFFLVEFFSPLLAEPPAKSLMIIYAHARFFMFWQVGNKNINKLVSLTIYSKFF